MALGSPCTCDQTNAAVIRDLAAADRRTRRAYQDFGAAVLRHGRGPTDFSHSHKLKKIPHWWRYCIVIGLKQSGGLCFRIRTNQIVSKPFLLEVMMKTELHGRGRRLYSNARQETKS